MSCQINREILREAKAELEGHVRDTFGTNSQHLRHLADDVLPGIIEGVVSQ